MHQRGFDEINSTFPIMKRATMACAILIASDLLLVGVALISQTPNSRVQYTAGSINLLINAIATSMCFANWRERLFPYTLKCNSKTFQNLFAKNKKIDNSANQHNSQSTQILKQSNEKAAVS